jgi:hypothetical protein
MLPGRTTPTAVAGIIQVDPAIDLNPFIDVANSLVTEQCTTGETAVTDSDRLEKIERYLAAHFYAQRDQQAQTEGLGAARITYQGRTNELYFRGTQWGQTACMLDSSGNLTRMSKEIPKLRVLWLGTRHHHHHHGCD